MSSVVDVDLLIDQDKLVNRLVRGGFSEDEAKIVLQDAKDTNTSPESMSKFKDHFVDDAGRPDVAKIDAYMHIHDVMITADAYKPVLDNRADNADHSTDLEGLAQTIEFMHQAGFEAQDIADITSKLVKISKSFTPHPTEHHSPEGIKQDRALVSASESDAEQRPDAIRAVLNGMIDSDDYGASVKSNIVDEIDYSSETARIHNAGVNELDREIEQMIFDVTGEHVDVNSNTGPRSWAYDADGKNNAEGFAMMMAMATSTRDAMSDLSRNLYQAMQGQIPEDMKARLETLKTGVDQVIENITPVYERTREINAQLATAEPKEREAIYRMAYEQEYEGLFNQLAGIYDGLDEKRGKDFYLQTVEDLDRLRKDMQGHDSESAHLVDEAFRNIRRNGFSLDKGQTRHNDFVYIDMIDNMFDSDAFWGMDILSDLDREEIVQKGGFSQLDEEAQLRHWDSVLSFAKENGNRRDLVTILESTNPLAFKPVDEGGNGYPNQEKTYLDRMRIRSLFPFKFEEGVISDAQSIGSPRQKFIADLFGMNHMKHMSLNEDPINLDQQDTLVAQFTKHGGGMDNINSRQERMLDYFKRLHQTLHVMRPASDAEKNGGSFTRLQAMDQYRKIVRQGYDMGVPIEIMIGGGGSLNRFGGDVDMVRRIAAQELKEIFKEKLNEGQELDDDDRKMMIMAASILYTEQGRTKRFASATPGQVRDDFAGKMNNVLQDFLDMDGHVADHTFIDEKTTFSPEMEALNRSIYTKAIADYFGFANVHKADENGKPTDELVLDSFTEMGGAPHLTPQQNNGARPAAGKAKGGKKAKTSGQRAIGKDQILHTMQSFHAGFFASGTAMKRVHEALSNDQITMGDVDDLMHNADWDEAIFSRNLIDAGRFNATHLFDKVSNSDDWTFDRAMEVGNEVIWRRDRETGKNMLHYAGDEDVSQEELYLAKIYYDRAVFLATTEAALTPGGAGVTMKDSLDDIIASVRPDNNSLEFGLGARTQNAWPSVVESLADGQKNAPAVALYQLVNDDIQSRLDAGEPKDDVLADYGDGDPANFDARARRYGSAVRSGTMPHKAKWTGQDTYGIDKRNDFDAAEVSAYIAANHSDHLRQRELPLE